MEQALCIGFPSLLHFEIESFLGPLKYMHRMDSLTNLHSLLTNHLLELLFRLFLLQFQTIFPEYQSFRSGKHRQEPNAHFFIESVFACVCQAHFDLSRTCVDPHSRLYVSLYLVYCISLCLGPKRKRILQARVHTNKNNA